MRQLTVYQLLLLVVLLSSCSNNSNNSNDGRSVNLYTQGDLTDFEITNINSGASWVLDSDQSKSAIFNLDGGAQLSIKSLSEFHGCWFKGWESEITINADLRIDVICNRKPLFNVVTSEAPNPTITSLYLYDGLDLQLVKETSSENNWPEWSFYMRSKRFLFDLKGLIFNGEESKFDVFTDKTIEHVFFDPDIDKEALFLLASNSNDGAELFILNESRDGILPVNFISDDLSVSDLIGSNLSINKTLFNYHHSFDGVNLTTTPSFETPEVSNLTNVPYGSDLGVRRIKLNYHDDLFSWFTEEGPVMIRRIVNENGSNAMVNAITLPALDGIKSIFRVETLSEKVIIGFNYGVGQECENFYEFDLISHWRLIFNTCDSSRFIETLDDIDRQEYLAINDTSSGWFIINSQSGEALDKIFPERTYTASMIYSDGILMTEAEPYDSCSSSPCSFIHKVYFYSFEHQAFELLLTTDPVIFQPRMYRDEIYNSPIYDLLDTASVPYNTSYKNLKFFVAYTAETGNEIWQTDGTAEGTKAIETFSKGAQSGVYHYREGQSLVPINLN